MRASEVSELMIGCMLCMELLLCYCIC